MAGYVCVREVLVGIVLGRVRVKEREGMKVCGISRVKGRRITSEISSARSLFLV